MIYLNRFKTSSQGTFGTLMDDTGHQLCFTVERPYTGDHPCVPAAIYQVESYESPTKGDVWMLKDVPDRTAIEIHTANTMNDLLGCIGVGDKLGTFNGLPSVMNSQVTFSMLKDELPDSFELTIRDTPL